MPSGRERVQQVNKGTLSLQRMGVAPCDLSLVSEVLLGKYNYPGCRVSSPIFPEKNQDSRGVLAQSVEDDRSPARKWWKEG